MAEEEDVSESSEEEEASEDEDDKIWVTCKALLGRIRSDERRGGGRSN